MPNTPVPPPKDAERFDDWMAQLHRNTTNRVNWTPTLAFATPGDSAFAYVTGSGGSRVGELYYSGGLYVAQFNIVTTTFTHTTSAGALSISGLPVSANSDAGYVAIGALQWQGITKANYTQWMTYIVAGAKVINCLGQGDGQPNVTLGSADMPSAGSVVLRGTLYFR